ncbi:hypothetical protein [Oceanobacillus kimchii]|uniref:hypothetical protein n=1 Tax=Oceanobacillus kimchii TaxID=746691 RepID=UPI00232AB790|nr:hypothetical protein [Oceanobacillus kimchii]
MRFEVRSTFTRYDQGVPIGVEVNHSGYNESRKANCNGSYQVSVEEFDRLTVEELQEKAREHIITEARTMIFEVRSTLTRYDQGQAVGVEVNYVGYNENRKANCNGGIQVTVDEFNDLSIEQLQEKAREHIIEEASKTEEVPEKPEAE